MFLVGMTATERYIHTHTLTHNHTWSAWSNFCVYEKGELQSRLNKKCKNVTASDILSSYHTLHIHASFSDFRLFWRSQESGERKCCVFIILNASQLNILPDAHARSQICLHKAGQIIYEVLHRRQQFAPVMVPFFCSQQLIWATSLFRVCTDWNAETAVDIASVCLSQCRINKRLVPRICGGWYRCDSSLSFIA